MLKPEPKCLKCGKTLNDFTAVKRGTLPNARDLSVCLYCGHAAVFTGNGLELRHMAEDEKQKIAHLPDLRKAKLVVDTIQKAKQSRSRT